MHYLYILHSTTADKYYVGETHSIEERLFKHNRHLYDGSYTKIANDWQIVLTFECVSKTQALGLEKFIKKMKSKVFIQKLTDKPEILNEIIIKNNL